jgi:hypothetical protein
MAPGGIACRFLSAISGIVVCRPEPILVAAAEKDFSTEGKSFSSSLKYYISLL